VEIDFEKLLLQVRMVRENNSSKNKGYAFIFFEMIDMASKAIKELYNSKFKVCLYAILIMLIYQMIFCQHIWRGKVYVYLLFKSGNVALYTVG
jgi:RNA recognition motif. (a.k.a. RRM, RBD, or RNP domain)